MELFFVLIYSLFSPLGIFFLLTLIIVSLVLILNQHLTEPTKQMLQQIQRVLFTLTIIIIVFIFILRISSYSVIPDGKGEIKNCITDTGQTITCEKN